jgi:hypothetical protein
MQAEKTNIIIKKILLPVDIQPETPPCILIY